MEEKISAETRQSAEFFSKELLKVDGDTFIRDTVKLIEAFGEPVVAMTLFMLQMQIASDIAGINLYELQQEAAAWEKEMHRRRWGKN